MFSDDDVCWRLATSLRPLGRNATRPVSGVVLSPVACYCPHLGVEDGGVMEFTSQVATVADAPAPRARTARSRARAGASRIALLPASRAAVSGRGSFVSFVREGG